MTTFESLVLIAVLELLMIVCAFVMGVAAVMWVFESNAPDLYMEWMRRRKARRDEK